MAKLNIGLYITLETQAVKYTANPNYYYKDN